MLKCNFSLLLIVFLLSSDLSAQEYERPDWENESVFGINKEKAHATFYSFPSRDDALNLEPEQSVNYRSLNGKWKFQWSKYPEARPKDFYQNAFDDAQWEEIPVPSNWEIEGYGIPIM